MFDRHEYAGLWWEPERESGVLLGTPSSRGDPGSEPSLCSGWAPSRTGRGRGLRRKSRSTHPVAQKLARWLMTALGTEDGSPSTIPARRKSLRKADERPSKPADEDRSAQMFACGPPNALHDEADFGDPGGRHELHPLNRDATPMKPLSKLGAVYLDEFKRALAWASCRRPTWEFWQGIGSKSQRAVEETA